MSNLPKKADKTNLIDSFLAVISPSRALKRAAARSALRAYDSAQTYSHSDWTSANGASANAEIRNAQHKLRDRARDVVRNSPFAKKAITTIVNNVVGAGIVAHIRSSDSRQQSKVQELWKKWAETTACDFYGNMNFYSLQALAMQSVVESGDVLVRRRTSAGGLSLQILESDYLNVNRDMYLNQVQGVEVDGEGRVTGYWLYEVHPGDYRSTARDNLLSADEVTLIRRIERPGQIRGVTWFHPVIEALNQFADLQNINLMRQKVAASYQGFVQTPEASADSMIAMNQLNAQRQADSTLVPGTIRYLRPGEKYEHSSPPAVDGYADFARVTLRSIAAGLGITYEAITGDYSNVNFSSGRMGDIQFQRNLEVWRWHMLIPQFCEPAFETFSKWCAIQGVSTDGCSVEWVPPARTMISPVEETTAIRAQLRMGLTTLQRAISESGYDYDETIQQIADANADMDRLGITLDSDPRKVTQQGMTQLSDPNQVSDVTDNALQPDPAPIAAPVAPKPAPKSPKKA